MSQRITVPVVRCGKCGHEINDHSVAGETRPGGQLEADGCKPPCDCDWTPNQVAALLLYGELTPMPMDKDWS